MSTPLRPTPTPQDYLRKTEDYLDNKLIPFWATRMVESEYGGFQTNFDRHGNRTRVSEKTLLAQARCLFTVAHVVRLGFHWPNWQATLEQGLAFLDKHFRDPQHEGYYWIVEKDGHPVNLTKVVYGHSFLIYALSECALVTHDYETEQRACALYDLLMTRAADIRYGGFIEQFDRAWMPVSSRPDGLLHKSLDVHMHLMEAYTTLYELTGQPRHRTALQRESELIFDRMVDPVTHTGGAVFLPDWQPIANEELGVVWGSDRFKKGGKPPEITSYGHNIELAWLYAHAEHILGRSDSAYANRVLGIAEHCRLHGIDTEYGGVYTEGHRTDGPTETNKEFWQQAEAMVGFLEAYRLSQDPKYFDAFCNVHDFVFKRVINWEVGEWYPLLNREGEVIWDYMGHNWKICYHTLRATAQVVTRLRQLV